MKTKIILLTVVLGVISNAHAYKHLWVGPNYGLWSITQNWTNNIPNPPEPPPIQLYFHDGVGHTTYQSVEDLVVNYIEVKGEYHFAGGGPNARLGFRDTNGISANSVTIHLDSSTENTTFEDDLDIDLTTDIAVWAQLDFNPSTINANFKGRINGTGGFHLYGGGDVEFSGNQANAFFGLTSVHRGILRLNKTGGVAVRGDLEVGGDLQFPGGKAQFFQANQLANTSHVTVHRNGLVDLDDHSQTIAGLTMTGGRLTTGAASLSLNGNVTVDSPDEIAYLEGRVALGFTPRTFTVQNHYTNESLHVTARVTGDSAAAVIKNGPGSLIISGTNSYNGATVINQGTLVARGPSPLGSAVGGTIVNPGATLHMELGELGDEPLTISGNGDDDFAALFVYGGITGTGPVNLPADAKVYIWPQGALTLSGVVSGPGGLWIGGGYLRFNGNEPNTYTGETYAAADLDLAKKLPIIGANIGIPSVIGPLVMSGTVRLIYDNGIGDTSPVTFNHHLARLVIDGRKDTIGSLASVSGEVLLGDGELTIGGNTNSTTSAAAISGVGGRLRKIGPGTLTLTGTNSYSGATTIEGGTLVINGIQPDSGIIVKTNAMLAGVGTVGTISSQRGGIVSPGVGPGRLNSKGVAFESGSILRVELNGPVAGVDYDQLNVTGAVHLSSCVLNATCPVNATNQSYMIIRNDGSDPVIGIFAGLIEGWTVWIGQRPFLVNYHGGDGNDVVLTQLSGATAPEIGLTPMANGAMQVNGIGYPGTQYTVEANNDLNTPVWFAIGTIVAATPSGALSFVDPFATNYTQRFYRFIYP